MEGEKEGEREGDEFDVTCMHIHVHSFLYPGECIAAGS